MSDFEFWSYLTQFGQITNTWWYAVGALPATIIAGCAYLLMWFALRRETNLPKMFVWLALASLPLVLILPSYYASVAPRAALERVGFPVAADAQQLNRETTLQAGRQLSNLATLGITGASLAVAMLCASLLIGGYTPPVIEQISQRFTKAMTRAFGNRRASKAGAASPYGVVKITRGQQQGTQFGIKHGALIGKEQATMTITDAIVSRRHARFEIRNELACVIDEGSTNGTHLRRHGAILELNGQGMPLEHGDLIYLGHPDEQESVELTFEKAA